MDAIEEFRSHGFTVEIMQDEDALDPRKDYDNLGTMICFHSDYNLGDEQPRCTPEDYLGELARELDPNLAGIEAYWTDGDGYANLCRERTAKGLSSEPDIISDLRIKAAIQKVLDRELIMLPLFLLDHGGITMNTTGFGCPWDSGQVGFIYVTRAQIRKEYGWKRITRKRVRQIEKYLAGEVEGYDQYLTGDVYGYTVEDEYGEVFNSCWNVHGLDFCREQAVEAAERARKHVTETIGRQAELAI